MSKITEFRIEFGNIVRVFPAQSEEPKERPADNSERCVVLEEVTKIAQCVGGEYKVAELIEDKIFSVVITAPADSIGIINDTFNALQEEFLPFRDDPANERVQWPQFKGLTQDA